MSEVNSAESTPYTLEDRVEFPGFRDLQSEIVSVPWKQLFPIKAWLEDKPWTLVWVQLLAFAFGTPFLLISYYAKSETPLGQAAWALSLYFAVLWAGFMQRCLRPQRLGVKRILSVWLFTSFAGVIAVVLVSSILPRIPGFHLLATPPETSSFLRQLIGSMLGVGMIEEAAKLIPVIWLARRVSESTRPVTMAWVGVISGLAFGATEAMVYSIHYAMGNAHQMIGYGDYLLVQVLRFVSLPLLHGIWTGTVGYFVGMSLPDPQKRRAFTCIGLGLASILHGAYNVFSNDVLGSCIAALSLFVFVSYVRTDARSATAG